MEKNAPLNENVLDAVKIIVSGEGLAQNVLGDVQTIKLTGKDTNGMFTIVENDNAPGVGIPMHVHENEDEVFRILEGKIEFIVEGKTRILKAGDTIFLPRQVPHAFKVVGERNAKAIVTVIPSGIEHMFEQLSQLPAGPPDLEKVFGICSSFGIKFV
ncbi:quercetin 2,3-dioxygenase [Flavobacterium sp.]|uniref:quercetin 2,3-dioxygenase n=1 Tax=Flavobacterium sp. TaxID=239 RepID=UPI003D0BBC06